MNDMILGASFSHRFLSYLHINPAQAIEAYKEVGLTWIRLGCYWDEIETTAGTYEVHVIEELLSYCDEHNIQVVLTIGMKAPRYPEYYIPSWLPQSSDDIRVQEACLSFITKTVTHLKHHSSIRVWQVENEPRDPSGPHHMTISSIFLNKEIETVKQMDPERKIMVTFWANDLLTRNLFTQFIDQVDIIGLDYYLRQPTKILGSYYRYRGPHDTKKQIKRVFSDIRSHGKEVWIAELQAEPWEPNEIHTSKYNPPSCIPEHLLTNMSYAKELDPDAVFLWGFEWCYECLLKGDTRYWNTLKKLI